MVGFVGILAHTGQGASGLWAGLIHPLIGIDHLLAMVAIGVVAAAVSDRRIPWAIPGGFVGGMAFGGVLGIAGVGADIVETTIAASVVVLGALIAATLIPSFRVGSWFPAIALVFGAAHGIAHGGEVPDGASPVAYVLGFVSVTVALHLSGVLIGSTVGKRPIVRNALAGLASMAGIAVLAQFPT